MLKHLASGVVFIPFCTAGSAGRLLQSSLDFSFTSLNVQKVTFMVLFFFSPFGRRFLSSIWSILNTWAKKQVTKKGSSPIYLTAHLLISSRGLCHSRPYLHSQHIRSKNNIVLFGIQSYFKMHFHFARSKQYDYKESDNRIKQINKNLERKLGRNWMEIEQYKIRTGKQN